jgi:hypothetical protein
MCAVKGAHLAPSYPDADSRVSFTDSDGVLRGVDVDAESLYEAVALAVASLREDDVSPSNPGTVAVYKNPTQHKIRLQQVLSGRRTQQGMPGA